MGEVRAMLPEHVQAAILKAISKGSYAIVKVERGKLVVLSVKQSVTATAEHKVTHPEG